MARFIAMTCILTVWSGLIETCVNVEAVSNNAYTDFGDSGWCFGADDYYAGTTSSAQVEMKKQANRRIY